MAKSKKYIEDTKIVKDQGKKRIKVAIATPMYGGVCNGSYMKSVITLLSFLQGSGYDFTYLDLANESLISRARNTLTEAFLRTDSTHLLFIDADQGFDPAGVLKMINEDVDVIGAAVPMKAINWERVKAATKAGVENIQDYTAFYNINVENQEDLKTIYENPNEKAEIKNVGTGLLLVKRDVFEEMKAHVDAYKSNQPDTYGILPGDQVYNFWNIGIDDNEIFMSEDFFFCETWKKMGGKIYLAPYVKVTHAGTYWFR